MTVDVFGDTVISRRLTRIGERARDLTPAWEEVMQHLEELEDVQFSTEGALLSGGWAPLRPSTLARKSMAGHSILTETGALRASLAGEDDADAIRRVTSEGLDFGTSVPYAGFHQRGTRRMVARPLLELPEHVKRDVVKILQRYLFATEG